MDDGRLSLTTVRVHNPCPRLYIAVAVVINTAARGLSVMSLLNHCDLQRHVGVNNLPKVVT